jgi:hypothetical protein
MLLINGIQYLNIDETSHEDIKLFSERYPSFDQSVFKSEIKAEYTKLCMNLQLNKLDALTSFCTNHFIESKAYSDVDYSNIDLSNLYNSCSISKIGYNKESDTVAVVVNGQYKMKNTNEKTNKEFTGMTRIISKEFALVLVHSQSITSSIAHCKKCGAPLRSITSTICEFCGEEIETSYDWLIDDIDNMNY